MPPPDLVVVAGPAGGSGATRDLLEALPEALAAPVVIALDPSSAGDISPRSYFGACGREIRTAREGDLPEKRVIYIAPPDRHVLFEADGTVSISAAPRVNGARPSIQLLFESAARAYAPALAGIVPSEANEDCCQGLADVARAGGATFVLSADESGSRRISAAAGGPLFDVRVMHPHDLAPALLDLDVAQPRRELSRSRTTILLVDDCSENLMALEGTLRSLDVACVLAHSGEEALSKALDHELSLILMDVQMPGMDGFEATRLLKGVRRTRDIPIVFVSAIDKAREHVLKGYEAGGVDYVFKPLDPDLLVRKVSVFVRLQEQRREIELQTELLREAVDDLKISQRHLVVSKGELQRANAEVSRRNAELEELSFATSHDLQEPLRRILLFSGKLENDISEGRSDELSADAERIGSAASRMRELVGGFNALTRAGSHKLVFERLNMRATVDAALAELLPAIESSDARITIDPLPELAVDRMLVTTLYRCLMENAIRFAGDEPPSIHVHAEQSENGWVFHVRDQGIGMSSRHLLRVFAPYKRLHRQGKYPGAGMGLTICRHVVARHGGEIWITPNEERGVTVSFTLRRDVGARGRLAA